jgi:guanyl-specific ribonuclease Sa
MKKKISGILSVLLAVLLLVFFGNPGAETVVPEQPQIQIVQEATEAASAIDENGSYTSKEDVALYLDTYGRLPDNFITKNEARELGWEGGGLEPFAPGKCIGGDRFGNYEGLLPKADGRKYTECDIDTLGKDSRGAKRIVFSNDGLIYYTEDHYESFELLYGEP